MSRRQADQGQRPHALVYQRDAVHFNPPRRRSSPVPSAYRPTLRTQPAVCSRCHTLRPALDLRQERAQLVCREGCEELPP